VAELFFSGSALWFTVPALVGTLFFVARLLLMLVADTGDGLDLHVDHDPGIDLDHPDSSSSFRLFSVQAISAFLMGFGWGGLGAYRGWGLPALLSVPVGIVVGGGMMWLLAKVLSWVMRLQSSGTVEMGAALFEEGTVYIAVPERRSGKGSVRLVINERLQYYHAVTDGEAIPSQAPIRVTAVNDDNTVTVERILTELPPAGAPS